MPKTYVIVTDKLFENYPITTGFISVFSRSRYVGIGLKKLSESKTYFDITKKTTKYSLNNCVRQIEYLIQTAYKYLLILAIK